MAARIRKDDIVVITAGKDKGKRGRVVSISADADRVVVEGVNMITRHLPKNPQNPSEGGRKEMEASIHISNVMHADRYDARHGKRGTKSSGKGA